MRGAGSKNVWALFLLILAGIVLGGFIGVLAEGVPALSWLSYGQTFGVETPIVLNLGLVVITFGLTIKITIASIIGVIISIFIYRFLKGGESGVNQQILQKDESKKYHSRNVIRRAAI